MTIIPAILNTSNHKKKPTSKQHMQRKLSSFQNMAGRRCHNAVS